MVNQTHALGRSLQSSNEGALSNFCILLARILIGLIFLQSGWSKLLNYDANVHGLIGRGVPEVFAYLAAPVEFMCGAGVILGVATGYAALLMLVFTIVATGISHKYWQYTDPTQLRMQSTNFWKNVSMMGGMLLLFVTGGGRFSVDAFLARTRGRSAGLLAS